MCARGYVRPFGATFGDVLTKGHAEGGLDFGRGNSSLLLLGILLVTIYLTYRDAGRERRMN
jgi:uncharacterized membrane-anchored protein